VPARRGTRGASQGLFLKAAAGALGVGTLMTVLFEGPVLAIGIAPLLVFIVCGFLALASSLDEEPPGTPRRLR